MNIIGELALIFGICLVGEGVAALLPMAFPASVISLVLLMGLLFTGVLKERTIQSASDVLLKNMAFFFLPPFVGTLEYLDVLREQALALLVVAGLTVPLIYLTTAWTVQLWMIRSRKRKEGGH